MKKLLFAALASLFSAPAYAATAAQAFIVSTCGTLPSGLTYAASTYGIITMDTTGKLCDSSSGGGGGGLSVIDQSAFTYGTSPFTPGGGFYNSSITPLSSGQQGAFALTANRSLHTLDDNSAAVLAAVQSSIPAGTAIIGKTGIDQTTDGTTNGVRQTTQYPAGAVAETASAVGTTAATTATLATNTGQTTYICWYSIRANATAAVDVTDTITGTITGTLSSLLWVAPVASGLGVDEMIFNPCVPASGTNQAIAVVSGAPSTGGNVTVKAGGYLK